MIVRAPAKLNLTLAVRGHRADGYHDLESWVVLVDLFDELAFSSASRFELEIDGDDSIPADDTNLVWKAAHLFAAAAGVRPGVRIRLTKRVPAGAGLGGGSSDAAACLVGLNSHWGIGLDRAALERIACELGSDVPLFLHASQVVMRGRGERVEQLATRIRGWVVLICPAVHVSTADVYALFAPADTLPRRTDVWLSDPLSCAAVMPQLFNDLEMAAFAVNPALRELHTRLNGLGGACVRMTGSGAAMFSLFDDEQRARAWAAEAGVAAGDSEIHIRRILTATDEIQF